MKNLITATRRFVREEDGVTAIEYGLIAALIAIGLIAGARLLGGALSTLFTDIATCLGSPTVANCTF